MRRVRLKYFLLSASVATILLLLISLRERSESSKPEHQPQVDVPDVNRSRQLIEAKKLVSSFGSVCRVPKCIAQYELVHQHSRRIPSIRHILWKTESVSAYFAKQLRTWNVAHPDWKYVLWRDSDLEKFVAKHYTGALRKFRSLSANIKRIDMIRYQILHLFGGVYADLDYVLVRPLDRFLKFPAVVTQETEAHAFFQLGMKAFPPPILGNPAFMMSEPGHPFFAYCTLQLVARASDDLFNFAGPLGLGSLLTQYATEFPIIDNPDGLVMVPASRNFYGFPNNSFASSTSIYKGNIINTLNRMCDQVKNQGVPKNITEYCKDVSNLDPITDRNELMYAVHDSNKARSSYDDPAGSHGKGLFHDNPVDIRTVLPTVVMADTIF